MGGLNIQKHSSTKINKSQAKWLFVSRGPLESWIEDFVRFYFGNGVGGGKGREFVMVLGRKQGHGPSQGEGGGQSSLRGGGSSFFFLAGAFSALDEEKEAAPYFVAAACPPPRPRPRPPYFYFFLRFFCDHGKGRKQ